MKPILAVILFVAACGGHDPAMCTWPAQYVATDAGIAGGCVAARYELSCIDATSDVTEECLSDERDACPPDPGVMGTFTNCISMCHGDEFAMTCGSTGTPPSNCRSIGFTPGGTTMACCPCAT